MTPTFILITKYGGQEFSDLYHSEREMVSAASNYEPYEIEWAVEILSDRPPRDLTEDCIRESIDAQREGAALRAHYETYARAS